MKTSRVLKIAKRHLARDSSDNYSKGERFICHAIRAANYKKIVDGESYARVKSMIAERLGNFCMLEGWLEAHHNIVRPWWKESMLQDKQQSEQYFKAHNEYMNRVQATRHAWVDSMIAEFRALGD